MDNIKLVCPFCSRCFTRKCDLSNHINNVKHSSCLNCGKHICGDRLFCSQSCSATYNNRARIWSDFSKRKTSESLKGYYKKYPKSNEIKKKYCSCCGNVLKKQNKSGFCKNCYNSNRTITLETHEKLVNAGKKAASIRNKRSKNEVYFSELIHGIFADSINNVNMFNGWDEDIIIPSKSIAILWNGAWHYKDICGGLKQTQNRDMIKYHEIVKAGYFPYIIVDLGKYSRKKCEFEFERFLGFIQILNELSS